MESALRDCCLGIKIGKILVQRHNIADISGNSDSLPPLSVPELSAKMVRLQSSKMVRFHSASRALSQDGAAACFDGGCLLPGQNCLHDTLHRLTAGKSATLTIALRGRHAGRCRMVNIR